MSFGERLRMLRDEQGITQEALANMIGVKRPTVAGYETKGKEPPYSTLKKLAKALNCSVDYLLGCDDEMIVDGNGDEEIKSYSKKLARRSDLAELLHETRDLTPDSVKRIVNIIKIIDEEVRYRGKV